MGIEQALQALQQMGGLTSTLGISFEVIEQDVVCRVTIEGRHVGAPGISHGGTITTLFDSALGARALALAMERGQSTSTVELKVNFLRPARQGQTLVTSTTIQSAGKTLLVLTGTASDEATGERIAFAVGTFNLYEADVERHLQAALDSAIHRG